MRGFLFFDVGGLDRPAQGAHLYVTGVTDVSQFPQLLVKRVDVVTGGASASTSGETPDSA